MCGARDGQNERASERKDRNDGGCESGPQFTAPRSPRRPALCLSFSLRTCGCATSAACLMLSCGNRANTSLQDRPQGRDVTGIGSVEPWEGGQ